jgi:hypothetical protein
MSNGYESCMDSKVNSQNQSIKDASGEASLRSCEKKVLWEQKLDTHRAVP